MQKRRLGISLYPERSTFEQDVAYLEKAAKLGFDPAVHRSAGRR